jgi:pimeloyl-ACP methyl ester carboxylesterase
MTVVITSARARAGDLDTHILRRGDPSGPPVVFVHGNLSAALLWDETMRALPDRYDCIAYDMRNFGQSAAAPVDATRGLRDFSDDLEALRAALGIERKMHLVGHSTGGGVIMQYLIDHPDRVASITAVAPISPFGYVGTKDAAGTLCFADGAGCGPGGMAPDLINGLIEGNATADSDLSLRAVMRAHYWHPDYTMDEAREDAYVDEILNGHFTDDVFPGDHVASPNWPGFAPGTAGLFNAFAANNFDVSGIADVAQKPPILWIRGTDDTVISDTSGFDIGYLGSLGVVPGWPGAEVYPPQPMVTQTRSVLEAYQGAGGAYREVVFENSGHSPFIDQQDRFVAALAGFLDANA